MDFSPYKSPDIAERALSRPCRELDDDDIGPYAGSATLTVGGPDDYKYFLPRILELSVTSGAWIGADPPIVADHLVRADWHKWSTEQQSAVQHFFDEVYGWSVGAPVDSVAPADLWLCGNLLLDKEPSGLLSIWRGNDSPEAAYRLAEFRSSWADSFKRNERPPFWADLSARSWEAVVTWLLDPATKQQIEAALAHVADEDRWVLDQTLDLIASEMRQ